MTTAAFELEGLEAVAASGEGFFVGRTALFFNVLWFCMANVSAAVVMQSGLPGLALPLLPLLLLLLSSDWWVCLCRETVEANIAEAADTASSIWLSFFGLELSGSDGGRSITRSGVCFCRRFRPVGVVWPIDDRFSHRSRLRTKEPLLTPVLAADAAGLTSAQPLTKRLTPGDDADG